VRVNLEHVMKQKVSAFVLPHDPTLILLFLL
jgi:hypothetical protein